MRRARSRPGGVGPPTTTVRRQHDLSLTPWAGAGRGFDGSGAPSGRARAPGRRSRGGLVQGPRHRSARRSTCEDIATTETTFVSVATTTAGRRTSWPPDGRWLSSPGSQCLPRLWSPSLITDRAAQGHPARRSGPSAERPEPRPAPAPTAREEMNEDEEGEAEHERAVQRRKFAQEAEERSTVHRGRALRVKGRARSVRRARTRGAPSASRSRGVGMGSSRTSCMVNARRVARWRTRPMIQGTGFALCRAAARALEGGRDWSWVRAKGRAGRTPQEVHPVRVLGRRLTARRTSLLQSKISSARRGAFHDCQRADT